jgi:ArsR family transcriptional regulator
MDRCRERDISIRKLVNCRIIPVLLNKTFQALASLPRRKILAYLSKAELTTSGLAERFAMSPPAVSRHLSILESADLIERERKGQQVFYRIKAQNLVNSLTAFAFEFCPIGRPLKRESRSLANSGRFNRTT